MLNAVGKDDSLVTYHEAEPFTTKVKHIDFSKAIRDLNPRPPVPPEEGIRRTVDWMHSSYRVDTAARRGQQKGRDKVSPAARRLNDGRL